MAVSKPGSRTNELMGSVAVARAGLAAVRSCEVRPRLAAMLLRVSPDWTV